MRISVTIAILFCISAMSVSAEDVKPLKALLITGGGFHDYQNQKSILIDGISARANVEWTVVLENPEKGALPQVYANRNWAKGYDVIVHNECFAGYSDAAMVERIVQDHVDNKVGAIMIHCAMHTFRDTKTKAWDKLLGVESRRHGAKFPIVIRNKGDKHPITKDLPPTWTTPQGELYHTSILSGATALGVGYKEGNEQKSRQVCIWANEYENCRVFATTLGHHNETMRAKVYLDMVARGLLWSCRKLNDDGKALPGYGKTALDNRPREFEVYLAGGGVLKFASQVEFAASDLSSLATPCCGR